MNIDILYLLLSCSVHYIIFFGLITLKNSKANQLFSDDIKFWKKKQGLHSP